MAVHIAARVMSEAQGGDVLVSRTVRDVLLGSRYQFDERGELRAQGSARSLAALRPARD